MLDIHVVPIIYSQEQAHVEDEISGKIHLGEAMTILVRYIDSNWHIQWRLIHFQLIAQSMTGEQVAWELIMTLSTSLLGAMCAICLTATDLRFPHVLLIYLPRRNIGNSTYSGKFSMIVILYFQTITMDYTLEEYLLHQAFSGS